MSEPITVRGARADAYRSYRDLRDGFDRATLRSYRLVVLRSPARIDAQTIALVLHGGVKFTKGAHDMLRPMLEDDTDASLSIEQLRSSLQVTDDARVVIAACEPACPAALVEALTLLYIAANARSITIETPDELPTEGGDADDPTDVLDKPPTGYGG